MRKSIIFFAFGLFLINARAAEQVQGVTDNEIVIGAHTSESGKYPPWFGKAMAAYFDDLNEKGGINGRKIKYIRIDTEGLHLKTVQATQTLVEKEKIFAMVGGQGISHVAVYKYLDEHKVADFFPSDFLNEYVQPIKKTLFLPWYTFESDGATHAEYVAEKMKGKRACFLIADHSAAQEYMAGAKKAFEEMNKKREKAQQIVVGSTQMADRFATQLNAEVLKLKEEKCDAVLMYQVGPPAASAVNFAVNQGYFPTWITTWNNVSSQFIDLIDKKAIGNIVATIPIAVEDGMGAKNFGPYKKLIDKNKIVHGGAAARGYFTAELFAEILKRAGKDLTVDKIVQAAEGMDNWMCSLCVTPVSLSPKDHQAIDKPMFLAVKDGKWQKVK